MTVAKRVNKQSGLFKEATPTAAPFLVVEQLSANLGYPEWEVNLCSGNDSGKIKKNIPFIIEHCKIRSCSRTSLSS